MTNASKLRQERVTSTDTSGESKTDIAALMQQIKAEARRELLREIATAQQSTNSYLLKLEELNYLNKNYKYPDTTLAPENISSHWPIIGPMISASRKFFYKLLRQKVLFNYFTQQREFQANLVRCLNELARSLDNKQLQLDDDYRQSLLALEDELRSLLDQNSSRAHQRFEAQHYGQEVLSNRLQTLEQVVTGLEQIIARIGKRDLSLPISSSNIAVPDYQYLLLENRFRGSEAEIKQRVSVYLPELKDVPGVVCEIGSGRGELQELLRENGVDSFGLELDDAMVEHCLEKGLNVCKADGIVHLSQLRDNSLGAIVALQVIEHLPVDVLTAFFELAARKLKSGGIIIVETINIASLQALRANYFRDPTHMQPLHPDTTSYMMQQAGLKVKQVRYLSPFPKSVEFEEVAVSPEFPPRFLEAVEKMNRNTARLNEIFFGNQDYAVIATVEKE